MRKRTYELDKEVKEIQEQREDLKETLEEESPSLKSYNKKKKDKIDKRKEKIIQKIKEEGSVKTGEVQEMFDVSRSTAYRYLSELEKEGRVKQTKKFGRKVRYMLTS